MTEAGRWTLSCKVGRVATYFPEGILTECCVTTTYQNIQQAYISFLAPAGNGLQIDFGKFVTALGNEVIETKDNWNYSRSLLFTLAIPYYHMGMRATYPINDKVSVMGFLGNG